MRPVPKQYEVSFGYGKKYPSNLQYLTADGKHHGIDYATPKGTPVIRGVDGIHYYAGYLRGYGFCVITKFTTGALLWKKVYRLILAHLDRITTTKRIGEKVGKWEQIGLSGASGAYYYDPDQKKMRNFYHLHAEVQEKTSVGWVSIDPAFAIGNT